jgi:uncharacterized protein
MFATTVPVIIHNLKALSAILAKAEAHCEAKKIEPEALLNFRLYPDMFPLARQVMLTTDFAKGIGARLSGTPLPSYPDVEKTFPELQARVEKTIGFLQGLDAAAFKGADTRDVTVRISRTEEKTMSGSDYFNRMALPNFYFHMTTTYNILRHNGLELGKGDFMGRSL